MAKTVKLTAPLTDQDVLQLNIGDTVLVSGVIYTARDAAHKRLVDLLAKGESLPMDIAGQIMYYVGPARRRPAGLLGPRSPPPATAWTPMPPS